MSTSIADTQASNERGRGERLLGSSLRPLRRQLVLRRQPVFRILNRRRWLPRPLRCRVPLKSIFILSLRPDWHRGLGAPLPPSIQDDLDLRGWNLETTSSARED